MTGGHQGYRRSRWAGVAAAAGFAVVALPGCQAAGDGPGCPPLSVASQELAPVGTGDGADQIRVWQSDSTDTESGETDFFTITACDGPVNWSISAPSYVTRLPRSGTLQTGQKVQVRATFSRPGVETKITIDPGAYQFTFTYSFG